ncbi:tyrosine recombinase XerC [Nostoc sp. 2RC]|uniref:site-specific integrase n=1 Tax=Nostoc sp. 2RC TaxID=2485484 RepID=UPI0016288E22|nr:site-specific integrase [Nostoc sp. 2RC]MBC1238739.1 tyrosine-type recombinase/integrase [Nostoc sp. 2RC]
MVNSAKTPAGKTKKGQVAVRPDSGSIKACFPRSYFADGKQVKLGTGINPDDWKATASKLERRLQLELEEGKLSVEPEGIFNLGRYQEILEEYGLRAKLRVVKNAETSDDQLPPKPELSLMEVWDMYCEYKKPSLKETVYKLDYCKRYPNLIKSAIKAVGESDASKIRNWLIENRNLETVKNLLSYLSKAYERAIKCKLIKHNPFDGMAEDLQQIGALGKKQNEIEIENDNDVLDRSKAFIWNEAETILSYVQNNPYLCHWHAFIDFKFLTGCRTGEAIAFMWGDILWDKEQIVIRRTYSERIKKFLPTKNETTRFFPMPKDGRLWKLLASIPQKENNETVFTSKHNRIISARTFNNTWRGGIDGTKGIIPTLINQGKVSKYLPPYNTRHTFISHQIFDLGRDERTVNAWCEHSQEVSRKHYQDIADRAMQINPELPANQQAQQQSEIEILKEQLRQQQELINKLLQDKDK